MKKKTWNVAKKIGILMTAAMLACGSLGWTSVSVPVRMTEDVPAAGSTDTDHSEDAPNSTEYSKNTDVLLTGVNAPAAKYGESTTIGFVAKVKGEGAILSISPVVSEQFPFESNDAAYMVVQGDATTKELSANYNFTVRSDVPTGYQAVEFNIEYIKDGVEYSVIKTVNVKFEGEPATTEPPSTEPPTEEEGPISTPRVIVTGFETDPAQVLAGEPFTLTLHIKNTSSRTAVSNMKIALAAAEGEFLPTSGSSTLFISSLGAGQTTDLSLEMTALASLEPKPYVLTLTANYEDGEANPFESTENISIPVYQEARIKITEVMVMPDMITVNNQGSVSFNINNLGKSVLTNVQVRLEGDSIECEDTFVGNIAAGATGYADVTVTGIQPTMDDGIVSLIITYEDSAGQECTYEDEVTILVQEEMLEDFYVPDDEMVNIGMPLWQKLLIVLGILVVIAIIAVVIILVVVKKKKKKKAMEEEDLEEDMDDELLEQTDKENVE